MAQYKLTYFKGRGRAEGVRMLFALADVDYEDNRVTGDSWQEFKPKTPMGQLPCLEFDGKIYCQSHAIERFLAGKFGFYGKDEEEKLRSDMVIDCLEDVFQMMVPTFDAPEEEKQNLKDKIAKEKIQPRLKLIENLVNEKGFMVSDKVMWADIALQVTLDLLTAFNVPVQAFVDENCPKLKGVQTAVTQQERIKAWIAKRPESSF